MQIDIRKLSDMGIDIDFRTENNSGKLAETTHIQLYLRPDNDGTLIRDMVESVTRRYPLNDNEQDMLHGDFYRAVEKAIILHCL